MEPTQPCRVCAEPIRAAALKCPHCRASQQAFHRAVPGKLVAGVCAALAAHLGVDVTLIRVGFVAAGLLSGGLVASLYVAFWMLTPLQAGGLSPAYRFMDWLSSFFQPGPTRQSPPEAR